MKKIGIRKISSIFLILMLVLQLLPLGIAAEEIEEKNGFTDLTSNEEEINQLVQLGIINGYPDGTFKPYHSITRAQGIAMIVREMKLNTSNRPSPNFKDIDLNYRFYNEIAAAVDEGIIDGFPDGSFGPNKEMTRSQMAKILVEAYNLKLNESKSKSFKDVPSSFWAYDYIRILASNGITEGYKDGTFNPSGNLNRLHFSLFLSRYINEVKNKQTENAAIAKEFELKTDKTKVSYGESVSLSINNKSGLDYKTYWKTSGGKLTVADNGKSATWTAEENSTKDYNITVTIEAVLQSGEKVSFDKTITISVTAQGSSSTGGGSSHANAPDPKTSPGQVLGSGENKVTLLKSTKLIDEETAAAAEVNADATQVIFNSPVDFVTGDVFILPDSEEYPGGLALKAVSIQSQDGKTIVVTSTPKIEEVYYSIEGKIDANFTAEDFEPAEGVTIGEQVSAASINQADLMRNSLQAADAQTVSAAALEGSLTLNFEDKSGDAIRINGSLELSGKFTGEVDWAWERDLVDSIDLLFEGKQTLKGEVIATSEYESPPKKLGTLTIRTQIPGLTLKVPAALIWRVDGSIGVEFAVGLEEELGFKYDDNNGARIYPEDKFRGDIDISDITGKATAQVGVQLPFQVKITGITLAQYNQEPGLEGELKTSVYGVNGIFSCGKAEFSLYYDASVEVPLVNWESNSITGKVKLPSPDPFGNCIRSIAVVPDELEMAPGEIASFLVKAHDGFNGTDNIAIDDNVSFESSAPDIATARPHRGTDGDAGGAAAEVVVSDNAQNGDEVTITVSFKVQGEEYIDRLKVKIVDNRERGKLVGQVVDAVTTNALEGASIKIYSDDRLVKEVTSAANGSYEAALYPGTYRVVVENQGYIKETSKITITEANTTTYDAKLQLVGEEYAGIGTVSGTITNALTGQPVSELTLEIRRGRNNSDGEIVKTVATNENGQYELELPGGNYTATVSGAGYVTTSFTIVAVGDKTRGNQNATISPEGLLGESIRIVLNWGATPSDLDSHITGPTADGSRFHVFYQRKTYKDSENDVKLDVDDTTSYGPETITIIDRLNEGTYVYAIHNYSSRSSTSNDFQLSNSEATVRVYNGDALIATFNVPIEKEGNSWKVFEIRDGAIVPVNKMYYVSNFGSAEAFAPEE